MKKLIFSGILATMFAISASFAQITHSLDTTNLTVGTTTIDSVKFVYGGLVSANLPASVRIDYVAGSGPVNGSNYSSIGHRLSPRIPRIGPAESLNRRPARLSGLLRLRIHLGGGYD